MTDGLRQFLTPYTHAHTHSADSIDETINVNFPKQPVSVFPFNHLQISGISLSVFSLGVSGLLYSLCLAPSLSSLTLSGCFWDHLEIQFPFPAWRIGMGRMSPPPNSLQPGSVLGEAWQAALAWGQLDRSVLSVTGPEPPLLLIH